MLCRQVRRSKPKGEKNAMELSVGMKKTVEQLITAELCTKHIDPNAPGVLSTPSMIAVMEGACARAVAPALEQGVTTVGTAVNIRHLAPTVEGQSITCEAELIEVDRRRLTFSVVVTNDKGVKIGEGTHERFLFYPKK